MGGACAHRNRCTPYLTRMTTMTNWRRSCAGRGGARYAATPCTPRPDLERGGPVKGRRPSYTGWCLAAAARPGGPMRPPWGRHEVGPARPAEPGDAPTGGTANGRLARPCPGPTAQSPAMARPAPRGGRLGSAAPTTAPRCDVFVPRHYFWGRVASRGGAGRPRPSATTTHPMTFHPCTTSTECNYIKSSI